MNSRGEFDRQQGVIPVTTNTPVMRAVSRAMKGQIRPKPDARGIWQARAQIVIKMLKARPPAILFGSRTAAAANKDR